jgi:lipopolysaccharide/colanic/teichoic acid biosynthesis glycosyltransferase
MVIIDSNITPEKTVENLLANGNITVIDALTIYERYQQKIPLNLVSSAWILRTIKTSQPLFYRITHSILDRIIALMVIVLSLPITIIAAIIIKSEDGGPIFYQQERTGKNGKPFPLFKFRSMGIDAEKNGAQWSSGASDDRVTRIGKIIRKLHIDELPQMLNILRGDLALIGPRAERPEFVEKLEEEIPHYRLRHIIKPGFTGWAQVKFLYARSIMDSYKKQESRDGSSDTCPNGVHHNKALISYSTSWYTLRVSTIIRCLENLSCT